MTLRIPGFEPTGRAVRITLDGTEVAAREDEPVAVSLLAAEVDVLARSVKFHRPRGPFCFVGRCEGCLVRIDGVPNLASCRVPARDGMRVERQNAFPSADADLLRTVDWFFRRGLDHHELFAWLPEPLHGAMRATTRRLSGLGLVPDAVPDTAATFARERPDVLVVGAGPAGLAAAAAATRAGARTLVLDEGDVPGGHLHERAADVSGVAPERTAETLARAATDAGATLRGGTRVLAFYDGEQVVAATADGLVEVRAPAVVLATGTHPQPMLYPGNDLPGTISGRAAVALVRRWGVLPGRAPAVVGDAAIAEPIAVFLERHGATVTRAFGGEVRVVKARGRKRVRGLEVARGAAEEKVGCDAVVVATRGAPAFELAEQAGCEVAFDAASGFTVRAEADGRTAARGVFVVGEAVGRTAYEEIVEGGAAAGRIAAAGART